jgi:hypothetical protein
LALVPVKQRLKTVRKGLRRRARYRVHRWTRDQRKTIRARFANARTEDLAAEFGVSVSAVRKQAGRMRLRKSLDYIAQRAREGRRQPIGTERLCTSYKNRGFVLLKVSNEGTQSEQWRPKHHAIWQREHGVKVPHGMRVVFRDGNKQNFEPNNLDLATRYA